MHYFLTFVPFSIENRVGGVTVTALAPVAVEIKGQNQQSYLSEMSNIMNRVYFWHLSKANSLFFGKCKSGVANLH